MTDVVNRTAMLQMMETSELVIDNNAVTTINDAVRGLLTAEAAINTMVSHTPLYCILIR